MLFESVYVLMHVLVCVCVCVVRTYQVLTRQNYTEKKNVLNG